MPKNSRELARAIAIFAVALAAGLLPSRAVREDFSRAISALGNSVLGSVRFHGGVRAELRPVLAGASGTGDNVDEDTQIVLSVPGRQARATIGISSRRDAYLPLVVFAAAVAALPVARRAKIVCLLLGTPIILMTAIIAVWILVTYLSTHGRGAPPEGLVVVLTSFLFERWLTPPGNRVISPLLFAAILAYTLQHLARRRTRGSARACAGPVSGTAVGAGTLNGRTSTCGAPSPRD